MTKEEVLRHRVLSKIMDSFGGCFLNNTHQFLRACRLHNAGFVTQTAKMRSCKVDARGNQYTNFSQWFTITTKGKIELIRLEKLRTEKKR